MVYFINATSLFLTLHLFFSIWLRIIVKQNHELDETLFAVPNAPVMPDWGFRLLRAKFFLFWESAPQSMQVQPPMTRFVFFVARVTGFAVPTCLLAFFASAFF
jgi:hypothetical protein